MNAMVKIWRNRVWAGTQILSECPAKYKNGVIAMMGSDIENGIHTIVELGALVEAGNVTAEEYEAICGDPYEVES